MIENYKIKRNAISEDLANFLFNYINLKKQVLNTYLQYQRISPFNDMHGANGDSQSSPKTFCVYGDATFDTLLSKLLPLMNNETGLKLIPTYSYARVYINGDELLRHKDRKSCEYSTTLHLGGDEWPIYIEPSGEEGKKGVEVILKPGDMLIYKGCELEHWRNKFNGTTSGQVFLHYNLESDIDNLFDKRLHLGLPSSFKK